ncbi:MAG: dodecin family protein [Planctomycetaceae bacterium]
MSVVKVVEIVGNSKVSWQDAAQQAVREAAQSLREITGIDVVSQTDHVEDGEITEYRATMHVAFRVEHHSHLLGPTGAAAKR